MRKLIDTHFFKTIAVYICLNIVFQLVYPSVTYALTSGPTQPEVQGFEPVGTTEMVDLFSGDFTYNIPLFELPGPNGGYPFNMAYHSGITMDQEASWVGLGWSLNPGAINRQMRGLPDEFNGDKVYRKTDMKPNVTVGVGGIGAVEVFGADFGKGFGGSLGLSVNVYYNNYKGLGYSLDPSLNFHAGNQGEMLAGLGFNFSLDTQEGVGVNASLSYEKKASDADKFFQHGGFNVGLGYNSNAGLKNVSLNASGSIKSLPNIPIGGALSFASTAYSPSISQEMGGSSLDLQFKAGAGIFGLFPHGGIRGFYNVNKLKNRNKRIATKSYGYLHLHNANNNSLMDFNREKDGMVREHMPNLASPTLTYDIYSVTGQGMAAMYRPYRNDIGIVHDKKSKSDFTGGSAGVDLGPSGTPHFGVTAHVNRSVTKSGPWEDDNLMQTKYDFRGGTSGDPYEPWYFKTHGEHTSDSLDYMNFIGGDKPMRIEIKKKGNFLGKKYEAQVNLQKRDSTSYKNIVAAQPKKKTRASRNLGVQPIKNKHLLDDADAEILPEFDLDFFETVNDFSTTTAFDRSDSTYVDDHTAGFTATNPDGTRYIYGIPAYNKKHVECQYSIDGTNIHDDCQPTASISTSNGVPDYKSASHTEQYYNKTEMDPYAHAYLLTSILGADYVDVDGVPGPSDGDLGYWVKFNYVRTSTDYKWRAPYHKANYMKGLYSSLEDDKAAYTYGEKEMWYMASVETKSHVAVFYMSEREDAKGASSEIQNSGVPSDAGSKSYRLDSIALFTQPEFQKTNPVPIKKVHFEYTYELCQGVPNYSGAGDGGKLTLTKLWFTYQNNSRGSFSKYEFDYHQDNDNENPDYNTHKYDRWGNYKDSLGTGGNNWCMGQEFPYTIQFDNSKADYKAQLDTNMAAWNLKEITLPSGGLLQIDYESDDYAYVQNKVAMQMMEVSLPSGSAPGNSDINHNDLKVYFKLENEITTPSLSNPQIKAEVAKYLDGTGQIYFKNYTYLRKDTEEGAREFVYGYADLDPSTDVTKRGLYWDAGESKYTHGFVTLKPISKKGEDYHPFAFAAWQHLRTNQPQLMGLTGNINAPENASKGKKLAVSKSLLSFIPTIGQVFKGFYEWAKDEGWGDEIVLGRSWIRLNSPDRIKYGGGVRVKQITISDEWSNMTGSNEASSDYGQVYDYTIEEEVGDTTLTISSGVASYEPMIGGDEIPLRFTKKFPEEIPMKTNNDLYFELPVNESYYPGPSVGYRKVTVKSLATQKAIDEDLPDYISTTGVTVHEFYTAKEFPVVTKETDIQMKPVNVMLPIPLIGQITVNNITASQGYTVHLNDMHGKLKKVSNYAQDDNLEIVGEAISWVEYHYKFEKKKAKPGFEDYFVLDNEVMTIVDDLESGTAVKEARIVGQDYDFVVDMRESRTVSTSGGIDFNTDILFFLVPVPIPVPWPNIGRSENEVRLAVTNKIIHSSGILRSTEAFDGQSRVVTENKLYDAQTGQPVLTTVNNNFDDPIYNYNIPAHFVYEGMGAMYKNIGLKFDAELLTYDEDQNLYAIADPASPELWEDELIPGDEFIVDTTRAVFVEINSDDEYVFYIEDEAKLVGGGSDSQFLLVRSGRRNLLSANFTSITALSDPTENRTTHVCQDTIKIPQTTTGTIPLGITPCVYKLVEATNNLLASVRELENPSSDKVGVCTGELNSVRSAFPGIHSMIFELDCECSYPSASCEEPGTFRRVVGIIDNRTNIEPDTIQLSNGGWDWNQYQFRLIADTWPDSYTHPATLYGMCTPLDSLGDQSGGSSIHYYNFYLYTLNESNEEVYIEKEDILSIGTPFLISPEDDDFGVVGYGGTTLYSADGVAAEVILTNQDTVRGYFSSFPYPTLYWKNGYVPAFDFSDHPVSSTSYKINNVLSTSAVTFSDNWPVNYSDYQGENDLKNELSTLHPYAQASGSKGIWRPENNYVYVTSRSQTAGVDIQNDGTYDSLPLFNVDNPFVNQCYDWRKTNEITHYSPFSYELENKDILGRKSAALYGHNGQLTTTLSANAAHNEIAFESFEGYEGTTIDEDNIGTGNLEVYTDLGSGNFLNSKRLTKTLQYNILSAEDNMVVIDLPFNTNNIIQEVLVSGASIDGYADKNIFGTYRVVGVTGFDPDPEYSTVILDDEFEYQGEWKGKLYIKQNRKMVLNHTGQTLILSSDQAHTGKNSLLVDEAKIKQNKINLESGKTYELNAWVRLKDGLADNLPSYEEGTVSDFDQDVECFEAEVVNPYFTNDINGWSQTGTGATWSWSSGSARVDYQAGATKKLYQDYEFKQGQEYKLKLNITGNDLLENADFTAVIADSPDLSGSAVNVLSSTLLHVEEGEKQYFEVTFTPTQDYDYLVIFASFDGDDSGSHILLHDANIESETYCEGKQYQVQSAPGIKLHFLDHYGIVISSTDLITVQGDIIEGWQNVKGSFVVPENTKSFELEFVKPAISNNGPEAVYWDDLRLYPKNSSIQTYVYDNESYRLKAVLDDNNYATFYYYDEQGNLYLIKKETERGIMTIQESFTHQHENPPSQ